MISKDDEMARKSLGYKWGKPTPRPSFRPSSGRWTWGGGYGREPRPRPGRDIDPGFSIDTPRPSYDIDPGFAINRPSLDYDIDPGFSRFPSDRVPWNDIDPGHSPDFDDPNAPPWGNPVPRGGGRPLIEPSTDIYYPDRDTEPYPGANDRLNALLNPTGAPLNTRWRGNTALETYQGDRQPQLYSNSYEDRDTSNLDAQEETFRFLHDQPEGYIDNLGGAAPPGSDTDADITNDLRSRITMTNLANDAAAQGNEERIAPSPPYKELDEFMDKGMRRSRSPQSETDELEDIYNLSGGGDPYYGGTPNSRRRNTLQAPNDTSRIDPSYWVQPDYMDLGVPAGSSGQPRSTGRYSGEAQGYDDYWRRR